MVDNIYVDVAIKLVVPTLLAFGFVLAKKVCQIISKKLDVEISAQEWEIIDRLAEEAVRSVEEDSRTNALSSVDKEELALVRIKQSFNGLSPLVPPSNGRTDLVPPSNGRTESRSAVSVPRVDLRKNKVELDVESVLRTKVRSWVNKLYNQGKEELRSKK